MQIDRHSSIGVRIWKKVNVRRARRRKKLHLVGLWESQCATCGLSFSVRVNEKKVDGNQLFDKVCCPVHRHSAEAIAQDKWLIDRKHEAILKRLLG